MTSQGYFQMSRDFRVASAHTRTIFPICLRDMSSVLLESMIGHQDGGIMAFSTRMKMSKWRVHECLHVLTHPFTKSVKQIQQARGTNSPSSLKLWHPTEYFEVLVDCTNPEILLRSNSKTSNLMPFSPSWFSCDAQSQSGCSLSLLHWHNHRLIFQGMQRWKPR